MSVPLNSPVVLVTGSSKGGIGFSLCEAFAAKGCTVYATARRLESMEGFNSPNIRPLVMDVVDDSSVNEAVQYTIKEAGRIDIVISNAGVTCYGPTLEVPIEQARATFDTNVLGMLRLAQAVFPHMAARKQGTFITIGSLGGEVPTPWAGVYAASKSAVHALTETLQMEAQALSPDIRVTLIVPGGVISNIAKNSKVELPSTSLFKPYLPTIVRRVELSQTSKSMPTAVFASQVADSVLGRKGPPRYLTLGWRPSAFKTFKWLPRGLALWYLWRKFSQIK
ncbi:NAD-binding protein [Ceratobasidium sp. AG-I]|nr:NAD-binding protein [Ceratobasidium sp. AG-I]